MWEDEGWRVVANPPPENPELADLQGPVTGVEPGTGRGSATVETEATNEADAEPAEVVAEEEPKEGPVPRTTSAEAAPAAPASSSSDSATAAEAAPAPPAPSADQQPAERPANLEAQWPGRPCAICQKNHKTCLCPTPKCWICEGMHWASTCTKPVCSVCAPWPVFPLSHRHHRYYCPKAPCLLCTKTDHTAADCGRSHKWSPEERRWIEVPRGPPPQVWSTPPVDVECWNCGYKGHYSQECKKPIKCHKCFEEGHYGHSCPTMAAPVTLASSASSMITSAAAAATAVIGGLLSRRRPEQPDVDGSEPNHTKRQRTAQ